MTSNQDTACILLSGGLDSVLSGTLASKEVALKIALTLDYGQRAAVREIAAAKICAQTWGIPHHVIPLPWLQELTHTALVNRQKNLPHLKDTQLDDATLTQQSAQDVWVPNRNGVFLNIAAAFAESQGCSWIITGFNKEEGVTFPDNTAEAVATANQFFQWMTLKKVRVKSLVQDMDKVEMVKVAAQLKLPFHTLWSCYEGFEKMCGRCESCLRSIRAYKKNSLWEVMKHEYQVD